MDGQREDKNSTSRMALPFLPPASLDSSFAMSCPTEADIDTLAEVYYASFAEDPNNTWWWPRDRDAMFEWLHGRIRGKMADRNVRHFQVVDRRAGEVVAFARVSDWGFRVVFLSLSCLVV